MIGKVVEVFMGAIIIIFALISVLWEWVFGAIALYFLYKALF